MSLVIRPAVEGDAALILSFIHKLAEYEKLAHEVDCTEADLASALFSKAPHVYCDLAFYHGLPAGFAVWFYNYSTFRGRHGIYIEDLFVDPAMRGKGIGKFLVRHLAQRCKAENLPRLQWWVLNWNAPAIEFYEALGAIPMSEWTVYRASGTSLEKLGAQ